MNEHIVDSPDTCPFSIRNHDGFPDGCDYDGTNCFNDNKIPEDCPLKTENIVVKLE